MGTRAWVAVVVMMIGPAAWMRSGADGWIDSGARASRHAAALDARLAAGVDIDAFGTGNTRFDGEWAFASAVMAALANAQIGAAHPAEREACAERAARAVDLLLDPDLRAFDTAAWGTDMLNLGARHEHAVLGYLALANRVDVLPMYLEGTYDALPKGSLLPKRRDIAAHIGPVVTYDALVAHTRGLAKADAYREASRLVEERVDLRSPIAAMATEGAHGR